MTPRLAPLPLTLALLAPAAWGQVPVPNPTPATPVASITVPAGSPINLYADKATGDLTWKLMSPKVPFQVYDRGGSRGVLLVVTGEVTAANPGTYKFALLASNGQQFDFDMAEVVAGAAPVPPKPPGPGPDDLPPAPIEPAYPAGTPEAIGQAYRKALDDAAASALEKGATGAYGSTSILASAIQDEFKARCRAALAPVAAELERQVGPTAEAADAARVAASQSLLKRFAAGIRGTR